MSPDADRKKPLHSLDPNVRAHLDFLLTCAAPVLPSRQVRAQAGSFDPTFGEFTTPSGGEKVYIELTHHSKIFILTDFTYRVTVLVNVLTLSSGRSASPPRGLERGRNVSGQKADSYPAAAGR